MKGSRTVWFAITFILFFLNAYASPAQNESLHSSSRSMVRIEGHVLGALAKASKVQPPTDESKQSLTLTIVLKRDHQSEFDSHLREIYDSHSKYYHHYLTQGQIADRFGPSRSDYDSVLRYLRNNGFRLLHGSENRLTLTVSGTRAQAERAFALSIGDYRIGKRSFYANDLDPALPAETAHLVEAVEGLSNIARAKPAFDAIKSAIANAICPDQADSAAENALHECEEKNCYDPNFPPDNLTMCQQGCYCAGAVALVDAFNKCFSDFGVVSRYSAQGLKSYQQFVAICENSNGSSGKASALSEPVASGAGQTVGLLEFDSFNPSDVADYVALLGLPSTIAGNVTKVDVDGGVQPGPDESEVLLDINALLTAAPGAAVRVYDVPFTGARSYVDAFQQMINDHVSIISNSWASCEDQVSQADAQAIDTVFQNAAAGGISVFNGSGDSGNTCLDGAANTVSVPADSPNATAVGGTTLAVGTGDIYKSETWWNGQNANPPTGQGGFGLSRFFTTPPYQAGLATSRSVPDVVISADPGAGVILCEADAGGCPNGLLYGGTSNAAPLWAAITADLNQNLGHNVGALNRLIYPLASTNAFHGPSSMGSDFAHVGLGSPDIDKLLLALSGQTAGAVSASTSTVAPELGADIQEYEPADGATGAPIVVTLLDSNGHAIGGKTVRLTANSGTNAKVSPSSLVSDSNGAAAFTVTDLTAETVTLTATDTSDGTTMSQTAAVIFVAPPATAASLVAPSQVAADGMTPADILITLKDSLGRPSPRKRVQINQTGNSNISGPIPPVTDANGQVQFTATDSNNETVTYSAVDVTDGNLPFPQTGSTTYSSSTPPGCGGTQTPAPGFLVPTYASGFLSRGGVFGNINFGCGVDGTYGLAWDSAGNLYAGDQVDGNLYKIPPGGGVANSSTMVAHIAQTLSGLVFDKNGNLFGSVMTTPSGFNTGYVVRINPGTGAVLQTVASGLTCPEALSVDPISGDLFTDDACSGSGSDNPSLWRISNPASANPTTTVYATLPHTPNANIGFAPDGTMYIWDSGQGVKVTGTNGPNPPVQTVIPPLGSDFIGTLAFGTQPGGGAQFVISNFPADTTVTPNAPGRTAILDLTRPTLTVGTELAEPGAQGMQVGPDGCVYLAQGVAIWKITNPAGGCQYSAANPAPGLSLTPAKPATNPSQGQSVSLSARFLFATAPDGTPVQLVVSGANPQVIIQSKTMNGSASFAYAGAKQGVDTLTAFALLNGSELASNQAVVTWGPGTDLTFLTVNPSPISAMQGQSVTLIANLTDNSVKPVAPLSGQQVKLSVGGTSCSASTNSNGNASCAVTPGTAGVTTLSATFAGTSQYNPSSDSKGFHVIAPVTTPTPMPIATPSPVPGRLRISPKMLNFGSVNVGSSKPRTVTITNLGRITKKKHPVAITIEMENSSQPAVFAVSQCPPNDPLQPGNKGQKPGSCVVTVTFKPAAATKYSGTLTVTDNVEPSAKPPQVGFMQTVQLKGAGKVPK